MRTGWRPGSETRGTALRLPSRALVPLAAAWAALGLERLAIALWPAAALIGAYFGLALIGLFEVLPPLAHLGVLIATLGAVIALSLKPLMALRLPRRNEALRALERKSGIADRGLSALDDTLAAAAGADSAALWQVARARALDALGRLSAPAPRPALAARDPFALRFAALLILGLGVLVAGREAPERLFAAAAPDLGGTRAAQIAVDAWVAPPAYTGVPPIFLTGERPRAGGPIVAPAGSQLVVRVQGASRAPAIAVTPESTGSGGDALPQADIREAADGVFEAKLTLDRSAAVDIALPGRNDRRFEFAITPDAPPAAAFADEIKVTAQSALDLRASARDDYGIVALEAHVALDTAKLAESGITLPESLDRAPLILALKLPRLGTQAADITAFEDLTGHVWAGLPVTITLVARDEIDQEGRSDAKRIVLPERTFTDPLARALVEQRRVLVLDASNRKGPLDALDALTLAPERFYRGRTGIYLAIRSAFWRLSIADDAQKVAQVQDLLWQTALAIEQGSAPDALRALRAIQQQLADALANGAPEEEIAQLMDALRAAMDRYLRALAEAARNGEGERAEAAPGARNVSPQDFQDLLDAIENMAQSGARDAAQQMLAELQRMLENLQIAEGGAAAPGEAAMGEAIEQLGDIIGRQRELLDETFREQTRPEPGGEGRAGDLARRQDALRRDLEEALRALGEASGEEDGEGAGGRNEALERADEFMGGAGEALSDRRFGMAGENQKEAIEALREGAGEIARRLAERMAERGAGEEGDSDDRADPLGRPSSGRGANAGDSVKVPEERELERAWEILRELQRRASERDRPAPELDYLERLLKRF